MSKGNMKNVIGDRNTTLVHDFIVGHEYEVIVRAVGPDGTEQAMENAARNTIIIVGKLTPPTSPAAPTTSGFLNSISLSWTNPLDTDFNYMEVWRSSTGDRATSVKIAEVKGVTYLDALGLSSVSRYYWLRAINTSTVPSGFSERAVGTSLGVVATDIDDFTVTASKFFNKIPVVDGDSWTDDSPGAGSVAWNAHSLYYSGVKHNINAANTADKYIYWTLSSPSSYQTAAAAPTQTDTLFIIAMNISGTHNVAWNSIANQVVGSAYILDAAIIEAKIGNLAVTNAKINDVSVGKLTAGIIFSQTISLAASGTDCYINSGKTDFTNADTGFILGVDFSDGSKPKFYIGSTTKYVNWDGSALTIRGTLNATDMVAGTLDVARIAATSIAVGKLDASVVSAGKIITGLLTATNIQAGTLTGRTVQTASGAGQRVVMDGSSNNLRLYDSGNKVVVDIDDDASGFVIVGDQTAKRYTQIRDGEIRLWHDTATTVILHGAYWTGAAWDFTWQFDNVGNLDLITGAFATGAHVNCRDISVVGTKVVGSQGAAVIDATDAASAITQLNALLARCRAHGLIA